MKDFEMIDKKFEKGCKQIEKSALESLQNNAFDNDDSYN